MSEEQGPGPEREIVDELHLLDDQPVPEREEVTDLIISVIVERAGKSAVGFRIGGKDALDLFSELESDYEPESMRDHTNVEHVVDALKAPLIGAISRWRRRTAQADIKVEDI